TSSRLAAWAGCAIENRNKLFIINLMSDSYSPIRVSTLRGDEKIPFNTYVKVAGKYILLGREGDSFEGARLERLKSKKIARMYVPVSQRAVYDSYIRSNLDIAYEGSKNKSIEIRT